MLSAGGTTRSRPGLSKLWTELAPCGYQGRIESPANVCSRARPADSSPPGTTVKNESQRHLWPNELKRCHWNRRNVVLARGSECPDSPLDIIRKTEVQTAALIERTRIHVEIFSFKESIVRW